MNLSKSSKYNIREDIIDVHMRAWKNLASAGTWLTGHRRIEVVNEIRRARDASSCSRIRKSLSPETLDIPNNSNGELSDTEVEIINRVVCDPGRLNEAWVNRVLNSGVNEGEYIEIIGIISMVMILDTFTLGIGIPYSVLPEPLAGEPSRYTPPGAKKEAAWLPIVEPEDTVESDGPIYPNPKAAYIYRGLSGVPQILRDYWEIANVHYLPGQYVYEFDHSIRAISRVQTELIAARVSALHKCAY